MKVMDSDETSSDEEQEVYGADDEHDVTQSVVQQQVISTNDECYETDEESLIELFSEEYISSDEEMCDNSSQNQLYADEIPTQIDEEDPNINFNWMKLGDEMKAYNNNYTSLRNFIERKKLPDAKLVMKWVMNDEDIINTIAPEVLAKRWT